MQLYPATVCWTCEFDAAALSCAFGVGRHRCPEAGLPLHRSACLASSAGPEMGVMGISFASTGTAKGKAVERSSARLRKRRQLRGVDSGSYDEQIEKIAGGNACRVFAERLPGAALLPQPRSAAGFSIDRQLNRLPK